jgi:hypothetical protein
MIATLLRFGWGYLATDMVQSGWLVHSNSAG